MFYKANKMADERISSYIDISSCQKETDTLLLLMDKLTGKFDEVNKESVKLNGGKGLIEYRKNVEGLISSTNDFSKTAQMAIDQHGKLLSAVRNTAKSTDELQKIEQQLIKTYEKRQAATSDMAKDLAQEKMLLQVTTKELKDQAKEALGLTNAYDALAKEFKTASEEAKHLGASLGTNSEQYKVAATKANELNQRLKDIDAGIGNHQRNVGDYARGWTAFNQTIRETPAFANSAQTGLMGISNNLPMFADEVKKARDSGKSWMGILKELGANLFSFGGIVTILTTILTFLPSIVDAMSSSGAKAKKTIDTLKGSIDSANDSVIDFEKSQESLNNALESSEVKDAIKNIETLKIYVDEAKKGFIEKDKVVKIYNKTLGDTMGKVSSVDEVEQKLVKNGEAFVQMTLYKSAAMYAIGEAAKKAAEADKKYYETVGTKSFLTEGADGLEKYIQTNKEFIQINSQAVTELSKFGKTSEETNKKVDAVRQKLTKAFLGKDEAIEQNDYIKVAKDNLEKAALLAKDFKFDLFASEGIGGKNGKKAKDYTQEYLRAINETKKYEIQMSIAAYEEIANNTKEDYLFRIGFAKLAVEKKKELLDIEKKEELDNIEAIYQEKLKAADGNKNEIASLEKYITAEKERINKEYYYKGIKDETDYLTQIRKINDDFTKKIEDDKKKREKEKQDAVAQRISEATQRISNRQLRDEELKNSQLIALNKDYLNGNISSYEQYSKKREAIELSSAKKTVLNQIALTEELLKNENISFEQRQSFETKLSELKEKLTRADVDYTNKATEEKKKKFLETLDIVKSGVDQVMSSIQSIVTGSYTAQKNAIQEQIDLIDKQKEAEINATNASALSTQEKADRITVINATAQAKKEELERRQRAIDQRRAQSERQFQVFSIMGNTAMAVTKALTEGDPYTKTLRAAIAATIGAAQLAAVLASPIPKYAKGRNGGKAELAIVGEEGSERIEYADGTSAITPNKPTLTFLPEGAKVIPHNKTIMDSLHDAAISTMLTKAGEAVYERDFDRAYLLAVETKLNHVVKAIENIPGTQLIDDGLGGMVKRFNYRKGYVEHIDNYFKS